MLLYLAFLAAAQGPAAPPERELLDAFKAACEQTDDLGALRRAATGGGWTPVEDSADPRLAKLIGAGREAVGEQGKLEGANFSRRIAGRAVYLVLSRYEHPTGYWGNGCRIYDFDAVKPLSSSDLAAWMSREPTGRESSAVGSKLLWEPGWRKGITVGVTHVPATSPAVQALGLSGNILIAQAIGGF
jgi:hypothetical protein